MSLLNDVMAGLKTAIQLEERVTRMAANVSELARDVRDIDKRLVRVETVIEIGLSSRAVPTPTAALITPSPSEPAKD